MGRASETQWRDTINAPGSVLHPPRRERHDSPTFGFQDHHVAELALALLVEALHLDVVGGLRLEVGDGVPVLVPLHHILLVVAVVVAVRRAVVDVEAVDGRVVHRRVLEGGRRGHSAIHDNRRVPASLRSPTVHLRMMLVSLMASL